MSTTRIAKNKSKVMMRRRNAKISLSGCEISNSSFKMFSSNLICFSMRSLSSNKRQLNIKMPKRTLQDLLRLNKASTWASSPRTRWNLSLICSICPRLTKNYWLHLATSCSDWAIWRIKALPRNARRRIFETGLWSRSSAEISGKKTWRSSTTCFWTLW